VYFRIITIGQNKNLDYIYMNITIGKTKNLDYIYMANNVNRMDKCMGDLKAAKEERKDYQEEAMQGGHWDSQISQVNKDIARLVAECNRHHKVLEGHPSATKHFPSWVRSRRWKGEKIKAGGRKTRRRRERRMRALERHAHREHAAIFLTERKRRLRKAQGPRRRPRRSRRTKKRKRHRRSRRKRRRFKKRTKKR